MIEERIEATLAMQGKILDVLQRMDARLEAIERGAESTMPALMNVRELAFAFHCKEGTIYKMFREGTLTNASGTRHVKATREQVMEILHKQKQRQAPARPAFRKRQAAARARMVGVADLIGTVN